MSTNISKSYLDIARAVIATKIGANANSSRDDAVFGVLSCTYTYSYHSLVSFCSAQLYLLWSQENSELRLKYKEINTFEELMANHLRGVKSALKELTSQKGITPLHNAKPRLWQSLNEFIKNYRDFFVHPNPEKFDRFVGKDGNAKWEIASETASGILEYIYKEAYGTVPKWVSCNGLKIHGIEVVDL